MPAKRPKAEKVVRKDKKKTSPVMKTKKPATAKPEKKPFDLDVDADADEIPTDADEPFAVVEVDTEAEPEAEIKTRLDLIRSRHNAMKKEIDQIRVALEEEPDD